MHRFFVKENAIEGKVVRVTGSDFNHICHSLRLQVGDQFIVNRGDGIDHLVEIEEVLAETIIAIIKSSKRNNNEPKIKVTLAQAIPKKNNMDLIVQKCTEIGVTKIIPLNTERTIVKLNGKKFEKRRNRWQKIAEEAAKQSRRGKIPFIDKLYDLKQLKDIFSDYNLILIPWEDEHKLSLRKVWQEISETVDKEKIKVLLIIGPEGGFATTEIDFVKNNGGRSITLGPRILRTETAGFVALTAVLYQLGELGG